MSTLNWWRERCLEWCYDRFEDGKFGDQKYLDDWPDRFEGIHELRHLGGGVAPWNMSQYSYKMDDKEVYLKKTDPWSRLVFFHFHSLKIYNNYFDLGVYDLNQHIVNYIYRPYLLELDQIDSILRSSGYSFNWHGKIESKYSLKSVYEKMKRLLKRSCNTYSRKELNLYAKNY
jgi:hypothetical protein